MMYSSSISSPRPSLLDIFTSLGLTKYCQSFEAEEFDVDSLMKIPPHDLNDLITTKGPRTKLLDWIITERKRLGMSVDVYMQMYQSFPAQNTSPSDMKILIEKVDSVAIEQKEIQSNQKEVQQNQKEIKQQLNSLVPPLPINLSSSELGNRLLNNCPLKHEVNDLSWLDDQKRNDLTPILSPLLHQEILLQYNPTNSRSLPAEKLFVAAITPTLFNVVKMVDPSYLLINSEEIQWIPSVEGTMENRDKPDLFMIPHIAFISHSIPRITSHEISQKAADIRSKNLIAYLFGECTFSLRDSVCCLLEAKKEISLKNDLGEIFPKLQNLYHHTFVLDYYCVLFDPQQLYLLQFSHNGLRCYYHLNWTTPKSLSFFIDFLSPRTRRPIWLQSVINSCEEFKVNTLPSGFLGSGATGKVFKVESTERKREYWALKVVDQHIDSLRRECDIMNRLRSIPFPNFIKESLPYLSPLCENPFYIGDMEHPTVGSILLGPVGDSIVKEERSLDLFRKLLNGLFLLHRYLIRHGDPRMPNVIRVYSHSSPSSSSSSSSSSSLSSWPSSSSPSSRLVWIDLRETQVEFSPHGRFTVDFRIFIRSFFTHSKETLYQDLEREYHALWDQAKLGKDELSTAPPVPQDVMNRFEEFARKTFNELNGVHM